ITSISPGRRSVPLFVNGLPLDLSKEKWAPIIGIILDTALKKEFLFSSIDKKLFEDTITTFQRIGLNPYSKKIGNIYLMKGHKVTSDLLFLGGIGIKKKQINSNLILPSWVFKTNKNYQAIILAKFLDTEGSVCRKKSAVRITQCTNIKVTNEEKKYIFSNCKETEIKPSSVMSKLLFFNQMHNNLKEKVISQPPLILVSIQLLLRLNHINSHLYPLRIVVDSKDNVSALWNLHIQTNEDIRKFYVLCGNYISIPYKKNQLEKIMKGKKVFGLPRGLRKTYYLIHAHMLQKEKGYFTIKDVIKATSKSSKSVYNELGEMEKLGLIQSVFKKGHIKYRKITELGENYLIKNNCNLEEYNSLFN
ncbi:MAG: hypothetical protein KJ597_02155, partial [Nanoarchaeota archaeon]|nr:hypothetical protein [Nanoarchaeota archaeon]